MENLNSILELRNVILQKNVNGATIREGCTELNDCNQKLIDAMFEETNLVLLSSFNFIEKNGIKPGYTVYDGQKIYNFDFDFCVPKYDRLLTDMLEIWRKNPSGGMFDKVYDRILALGGYMLHWS